jgi:hypothetical protein
MWNNKFEDRLTGGLIRGDFVWVTPSGARSVPQTAMFLGHKEKTVEVQLQPNTTSKHLKPCNVIPWERHMDPWPWGNRPANQRSQSTRRSNRANGGSARDSMASSNDSTPEVLYRTSAVMGSNLSPASSLGYPNTPARAQLQSLINQERRKIEQSQEHIVTLMQVMELLDVNSEN